MRLDIEPPRIFRSIEKRTILSLSRINPFSTAAGGPDPEAIASAIKCLGAIAAGGVGFLLGAEVMGQSKGLAPGESTRLLLDKGKEFFTKDEDNSKRKKK